jgi:hypothetical protein
MAKDYTGAQSKATTLIQKFGRTVDLLKESRVSADPGAPWEGTTTSETRVEDVYAVFVPLYGETAVMETVAALGGTVNRSKNCFLIANVAGQDVRTFQKVVDGSKVWRITQVNVIQPGGTVLMYEVEVDG